MTARTEHSAGRDSVAIVCDFASAVGRLNGMAHDWEAGQFRAGDTTDANNLIEGLRALLIELRQVER